MVELITKHFSTILSIVSVLITLVITNIANSRLRDKDYKLKILEKIFDKRLQAYLDLDRIKNDLRDMISLNDSKGISYCHVSFQDTKSFKNWIKNTQYALSKISIWLLEDARIEVKVLSNYISLLCKYFESYNGSSLLEIGQLTSDDFVFLGNRLESVVENFIKNKQSLISDNFTNSPSIDNQRVTDIVSRTELMKLLNDIYKNIDKQQ